MKLYKSNKSAVFESKKNKEIFETLNYRLLRPLILSFRTVVNELNHDLWASYEISPNEASAIMSRMNIHTPDTIFIIGLSDQCPQPLLQEGKP
jgi:hypothetical protein